MATVTLTDEIVSALRRRFPDYDIWITKRTGRGYVWSGRKKGAELGVIADDPIAIAYKLTAQP
jgi:hypothetical protein